VAERPDDGLDVPLTRVGGDDRSSRRRVAIVGIATVIVGWLVVTAASGHEEDAQTAMASGTAPVASAPTIAPTASDGSVRTQASDLPDIANVALPGAPSIVFVARDGDDAELLGWRAGAPGLESVGSFGGAFPPDVANTVAWLSPDLASLVVSTIGDPLSEGEDPVRLVTSTGVAWESTGVTSLGGLVWSPAGDRIAMSGRHDRWLLLERRDTWDTVAEVDVSAGRSPTGPSPTPHSAYGFADRIGPAGFSSSGEWIVGARLDPASYAWVPSVRVRFRDGAVEPLSAFPVGGAGGLQAGPSQVLDASSGRTIAFGPNANTPGGPPQLEVHESDGSYAFGVRAGVIVGWAWTGDGRLVVLGADGTPFPARWVLQLVDADGRARNLVDAQRAAQGTFLGVRDGYAGLLLVGSEPSRSQVVVVRLNDGAASAITVDSIGSGGPIGATWAP
jgi:hypothetical protein